MSVMRENRVRIRRTISTLVLIAGMTTSAQAQLPDAPHARILSRTDWVLLAGEASVRTLDTISTRRNLTAPCGCDRELFLPPVITGHAASLAAYEASVVVTVYFSARLLRKHHHPRLATALIAADIVNVAPFVANNFAIRARPEQDVVPRYK